MSQNPDDQVAKSGLKFVLGFLVYLLTTGIVLGALGFFWAAHSFNAAGPLAQETLISVERGKGLNQIASLLEDEGAISNRYLFIFGTRFLGAAADLKAGEYQLEAGVSAKDIVAKMRDHDVFGRRVTIREGLTSFEIVRLLKGVEELSGEVAAVPPEGSLLPNTYDYRLDEPRTDLIDTMQHEMVNLLMRECWKNKLDADADKSAPRGWLKEHGWNSVLKFSCGNPPLNYAKEVLTLASIIEKETGVAGERRKVAGVFINRLKRGMPLQTDPTVIYAITKGEHKNDGKGPLGRRLLRKDLQYESPYNTYKYPGLPPGPIANPGKASIEAALNPETHDYIFFVADGTGGHAFGKTLSEHNANVAKWRKIRRQQAKKKQ